MDGLSAISSSCEIGQRHSGRSGLLPAPQEDGDCGQHSRWLLHEIEPGTRGHRIAGTARFPGKPDVPALEHALDTLAERHASLRMTFPSDSGPATRANAAACLREADAGDLDDAQLAKLLSYAAEEPFDLARGPLLRIHLYHRTDETVVLIVAHHFIADLWSMTTLVRELEMLYIKQAGDLPAPLPQPAVTDREVVRLYRWVGGTRAWVHAAQSRGFGSAQPRMILEYAG